MVSIEGENLRPYTLVIIEEVKSGDWSVGGQPLETGHSIRESFCPTPSRSLIDFNKISAGSRDAHPDLRGRNQ
jgi:hypothetical protein